MADNCDSEPRLVEDFEGFIKLYSDGSVVRAGDPTPCVAISEVDNDKLGPYKDVVFDEELGLWARLYLPPHTKTKTRLLVLLFFHASGFCALSPATPFVHRMCLFWAARLGVIIVSVKYRLAPEHRLPAAYEDSTAALQWLLAMKAEGMVADPWLHSHADLSNIFLTGESAGGNIAHHVGMWAAAQEGGVQVKGMILLCPFFGGEDRTTPEEVGLPRMATVVQTDILWRMALPAGSNRDHPFCNPVGEGTENAVSSLALPPMLFVIAGLDILRDKELQYCELLKKCGKHVEVVLFEEEDHGFTLFNTEDQSSLDVLRRVSDFIKSNGGFTHLE